MPAQRKEIAVGATLGSWTVLDPHVARGRHTYCLCACACGVEKEIRRDSLMCGDSTECHSCASRKVVRHGESRRDLKSVEYKTWSSMLGRCSDDSPCSERYADRGITVCEEWRVRGGFESFLEHVGRRPSPEHSLDRIDNDRGYEPGNVRWATGCQQQRNRRNTMFLEIDGVRKPLIEWAEANGLSGSRVHARIRSGWDYKTAVTAPSRLGSVSNGA